MSIIEANITIDVEPNTDVDSIIAQINEILYSVNSKSSQISMLEMDNPIHNNPLNFRPGV